MTLNAMQPDLIVVRHNDAGAVHSYQKVNCGVINAEMVLMNIQLKHY